MLKLYPEDIDVLDRNYVEPFHLRFDLTYDPLVTDDQPVHLEAFKYNNEKVFGCRFSMESWEKFTKRISSFDSKIPRKLTLEP